MMSTTAPCRSAPICASWGRRSPWCCAAPATETARPVGRGVGRGLGRGRASRPFSNMARRVKHPPRFPFFIAIILRVCPMRVYTWLKFLAFAGMFGLLAACQDSEAQAERPFENAMALMAEGDTARAAVEFRNVFQNNGQHVEARANFAAMLRREGDVEGSYSQYMRLVEQRPDHLEALTALSEMALTGLFWDEARRHGARLLELAPDDPATAVIAVNLTYIDAIEAEDE